MLTIMLTACKTPSPSQNPIEPPKSDNNWAAVGFNRSVVVTCGYFQIFFLSAQLYIFRNRPWFWVKTLSGSLVPTWHCSLSRRTLCLCEWSCIHQEYNRAWSNFSFNRISCKVADKRVTWYILSIGQCISERHLKIGGICMIIKGRSIYYVIQRPPPCYIVINWEDPHPTPIIL